MKLLGIRVHDQVVDRRKNHDARRVWESLTEEEQDLVRKEAGDMANGNGGGKVISMTIQNFIALILGLLGAVGGGSWALHNETTTPNVDIAVLKNDVSRIQSDLEKLNTKVDRLLMRNRRLDAEDQSKEDK